MFGGMHRVKNSQPLALNIPNPMQSLKISIQLYLIQNRWPGGKNE
jgi:hypothetical protein